MIVSGNWQKILIIFVAGLVFGGCSPRESNNTLETKPTEAVKKEETQIEVSQETLEYRDDNFGFSLVYPKSLNFEKQDPYPGGTIRQIGFRVDGITESQMLNNNDLPKSLMQNNLYCNLDESYGSAVCVNKKIEEIKNLKGVGGYKISREKTFYDEDGKENIFEDLVYAFPLKTKIGVSTYRAIILTVKYPSEQNLEILKNISETVQMD